MKEFFLDEFKDEQAYKRFIEYMLLHSEVFSVINFKYRENEKTKRNIKQILDSLKKYKISSKNTQKWAITAHEHMAYLYTDNMDEIEELQSLGAKLTLEGTAGEVFYLKLGSEDAYKL